MKKILGCLALLLALAGSVPAFAQAGGGSPVYQSWFPVGTPATLSVTTASAAVPIPTGGTTARVCNTGNTDVYLVLGTDSGITSSTGTGSLLAIAHCQSFNLAPFSTRYTYVAAVTASASSTIRVESGLGAPIASDSLTGTGGGGGGSVTSVGLSMPDIFAVAGSPVTSADTLTATLNSQTQNLFFASPSGSSGTPSFRGIAAADLPLASSTTVGAVKPDNTTITVNPATGVITAPGAGAVNLTAGNGVAVNPNPINGTGAIGLTSTVNAQTGTSYTTLTSDAAKIVTTSNASPVATSLSAASTTGFTAGFGTQYDNIGAGAATVTATTSIFDNGLSTLVLNKGQGANVFSDGTNYHSVVSLPVAGANQLVANASGTANYPIPTNLTALIDSAIGNTQGGILYRGASTWSLLGPGSSGQFLKTQGAAANPVWATGGGGGSGCIPGGTLGQVLLDSGSGSCNSSSGISDNGTTVVFAEPLNIKSNPVADEVANEAVTGTTLHKLAKYTGAPSTATLALTGDTVFQGIVVGGAGTTGSAQIARLGITTCVFDGATTAGHWVVKSLTVDGDCSDSGSGSVLPSVQVVGKVTSTNGSGGTYSVDVSLQNLGAAAGTPTSLFFNTAVSLAQGGTTGLVIGGSALTATDTLSTTTQATEAAFAFPAVTVAATHAFTATRLVSLYLPAPIAGTNVTATNLFSLQTAGAASFGGNITGTAGASLSGGTEQINGTTNINVGQTTSTNINTGASSGTVTIGNSGNQNKTQFAGLGSDSTLSTNTVCIVTGTNVVYFGSGTAGVCNGTVSSIRFKQDVTPIDYGLISLLRLRPVNWRYNKGIEDGGKNIQRGFIAENVAAVAPRLAHYDAKGRPNGVDLLGMVPTIVRAVQQQSWLIALLFLWNAGLTLALLWRRGV